jgi:hypothetical protein
MIFPAQRGGLPTVDYRVQSIPGKRNAVQPPRRFR